MRVPGSLSHSAQRVYRQYQYTRNLINRQSWTYPACQRCMQAHDKCLWARASKMWQAAYSFPGKNSHSKSYSLRGTDSYSEICYSLSGKIPTLRFTLFQDKLPVNDTHPIYYFKMASNSKCVFIRSRCSPWQPFTTTSVLLFLQDKLSTLKLLFFSRTCWRPKPGNH